jgi:hypothetical protein
MVDQIINYDEEMVGANHPSKTDTLNRALLIEHNADGTHKTGAFITASIFDVEHSSISGIHNISKVLPTPTFLVEHRWDGVHTGISETRSKSLANNESIEVAKDKNGFVFCMIGDNEGYAYFRFSNIGAINIIINTSYIMNSNIVGNLCIYNIGNSIIIKNRLGDTKTLIYEVHIIT